MENSRLAAPPPASSTPPLSKSYQAVNSVRCDLGFARGGAQLKLCLAQKIRNSWHLLKAYIILLLQTSFVPVSPLRLSPASSELHFFIFLIIQKLFCLAVTFSPVSFA